MTIYLDVVLVENLCMNYIILYATGIIYKIKPNALRLLLASSIGAVYAILSYMQILEIYSNLLLKVLLSIGMVYLAFAPKTRKSIGEAINFILFNFFCVWRSCICITLFCKATRYIYAKWNIHRNLSNENCSTRCYCRIPYYHNNF